MKPGELGTVLDVRRLTKTFEGQKALDAVRLQLRGGEVHALLGQNGCGKSTLIKCLAGFHRADEGSEILVDGMLAPLHFDPARALAMGLVFVHQDLGLIPNLSAVENFEIPRSYGTGRFAKIRWSRVRESTARQLHLLGHSDIAPDTPVGRLSVAQQTVVAIARALGSAGDGARLLVLDEPTAALPDSEAEQLFTAVRKVVDRGLSVLYVTHKLDELSAFVDRATVLRDGKNVGTVDIAETGKDEIVRMIVGRDVEPVPHARPLKDEHELLKVEGLAGNRLKDVSFSIKAGEIVGVAGMLGSGRSELARILFGAQQPAQGSLWIRGKKAVLSSPREAVAKKIALIPENRRRDGGVLEMSVRENLTLTSIGRFWKRIRILPSAERRWAAEKINEYDVRPANGGKAFRFLSGGNQQKVVIAKWLETDPDIVIFDEPVQGVDIGARAEIFRLIGEASERGAAVLLISSEIEQMIALSHRVLVLRRGQIVADEPSAGLSAGKVTRAMYFDDEDQTKVAS